MTDRTSGGGASPLEARAEFPNVPGMYRLPCGECYAEFLTLPDGDEVWLVPGENTPYTAHVLAATRSGPHGWQRMYTLTDAVHELDRRTVPRTRLSEIETHKDSTELDESR
ncbi:hypothetical protein [Microbacterium sp. PAMC22086]|uniref:hypothetical protein n=1 Tax=Microbacterium sp. PAMC22086 TaxID=2861281 RepID=UPI001C62F45E|nr:hypothetical protein [Microbacterium sp. PAMC22086]QYG11528.1 hypothetical protein KY497_14935 [Microbacterium sp. PAMC22086]